MESMEDRGARPGWPWHPSIAGGRRKGGELLDSVIGRWAMSDSCFSAPSRAIGPRLLAAPPGGLCRRAVETTSGAVLIGKSRMLSGSLPADRERVRLARRSAGGCPCCFPGVRTNQFKTCADARMHCESSQAKRITHAWTDRMDREYGVIARLRTSQVRTFVMQRTRCMTKREPFEVIPKITRRERESMRSAEKFSISRAAMRRRA